MPSLHVLEPGCESSWWHLEGRKVGGCEFYCKDTEKKDQPGARAGHRGLPDSPGWYHKLCTPKRPSGGLQHDRGQPARQGKLPREPSKETSVLLSPPPALPLVEKEAVR